MRDMISKKLIRTLKDN